MAWNGGRGESKAAELKTDTPYVKNVYRKKKAGTIEKCPKCQQWHELKAYAGEARTRKKNFSMN